MLPPFILQSIAYFECSISEHRQRCQELFPHEKELPKHHFLEHYPELIKYFGPLVTLWTMQFEANHSFFKQMARHTNNFKIIALTLVTKHQFMVGYNMLIPDSETLLLEVANISKVPTDVLNEDYMNTLTQKYSEVTDVNLAHIVTINGNTYKKSMIVVHGSCGGLPEFSEIIQLCIVKDDIHLIYRKLSSWYREHYRSYELHPSRELALVHVNQWQMTKLEPFEW